jgi:hypothetical protein
MGELAQLAQTLEIILGATGAVSCTINLAG